MKKISLVIATYNRAEQLIAALDSVVVQSASVELWECVVVDNNSQDATEKMFGEFMLRHPAIPIKMVKEMNQGLSHARNRGIAESCGKYIAIIDDDERINSEFLAAYITFFDNYPNVASAGGVIIAEYPTGSTAWMSKYTEQPIANPIQLGDSIRPFPKGRIPGGGNMAVRRDILDKYGAFNTSLGRVGTKLVGGEESDFFERLANGGEKCFYVPNAVIWHIIPFEKLTKEYFVRLSYNVGVSQRMRAKINNRYIVAMFVEIAKWCLSLVIALVYLLQGNFSKATYLLMMRKEISKGLFKE